MASTFLQRWLRQPQSVWLRRLLFQIHLWTGIGTGLYVLLISISGSILVFRVELDRLFETAPVVVLDSGEPLSDDELKKSAQHLYPGHKVEIWRPKNPDQAIEVWVEQDGTRTERLFHPYTGQDLGPAVSLPVRFLLWTTDFHDNLLDSETGRKVNGIGGLFLTVLCLTGAVVWWPGIKSWRRSLIFERKANWRRFNWTLHSAMGFWTYLFVFMWAFTGFYLVFQEPFIALVDYLQPLENADEVPEEERLGDTILRWLARIHFGRFYGWPVKVVWAALGVVPAVLFVTGALMWWNRKLRKLTNT